MEVVSIPSTSLKILDLRLPLIRMRMTPSCYSQNILYHKWRCNPSQKFLELIVIVKIDEVSTCSIIFTFQQILDNIYRPLIEEDLLQKFFTTQKILGESLTLSLR